MRHLEVTHVYVIAVPEDDVDAIDAIAQAGVTAMENFMKGRAAAIQDLHSDWKLMPKEYSAAHSGPEERIPGRVPKRYDQDPNLSQAEKDRDSILSKQIIEADADAGFSLTGDAFGQRNVRALHPWDQGLYLFPEGHPLHEIEVELKRRHDLDTMEKLTAIAPKLKELPSGD